MKAVIFLFVMCFIFMVLISAGKKYLKKIYSINTNRMEILPAFAAYGIVFIVSALFGSFVDYQDNVVLYGSVLAAIISCILAFQIEK